MGNLLKVKINYEKNLTLMPLLCRRIIKRNFLSFYKYNENFHSIWKIKKKLSVKVHTYVGLNELEKDY